ncbi:MAG: DUF1552 domain-containing protein [Planctomycetota bacterium]
MINRRQLMRTIGKHAGACSLTPFLMQMQSQAKASDDESKRPKRFVFVIRSNGVLTREILPEGMEDLVKERPHASTLKAFQEVSLADKKMPVGMKAIEPFKEKVTLIQGLSGKMINGNHEGGFGALGAYNGWSTPRDETIDWALARHLGGVIPHLGFTMESFGKSVTYPKLSASGPRKPLPYYADPLLAYTDLFGTIATGGKAKASVEIDGNILDFMVNDVKRYQGAFSSEEREKLGHYLEGFSTLRERQAKLRSMSEALRNAAPELQDHFTSEIETERVRAHFDLAASSLIAGLTNVCTIRCEHLGLRLTGLGLGARTVHHIGHMLENKNDGNTGGLDFEGDAAHWGEFKVRQVVMDFHMQQIARLYAKLKEVPEGNGSMADNTVVVYLSDHGDRHHSNYDLWPMTILGDAGGALRTGRYIQYPGYQNRGNQTLGNFYLSLLHAAGDKRESFGYPDLTSPDHIDQKTPLTEWMA